jgi:outer membrane protein OmpA-like peptidoglycan-associated protein
MKTFTLVVISMFAAACASVTPKQLGDARRQYEAALLGPAASSTPADLYEAKKALDEANDEFARNGNTPRARSLAYVAGRKVELANVKARSEEDRLRLSELTREATALRDQQLGTTRGELETTRKRLEAETQDSWAARAKLEEAAQNLEAEREARRTAEGKLDLAMKDLATVAAVKEESRGVVITLSGSVLFATGQSKLLSTAESRLDQVAQTLTNLDGQKITVEGHTDSVGPQSYNEQLSQLRATAVRDYLVSKGVPAQNIEAKGFGSSRPLLDNTTAGNRANNRRVEIVVQPKPSS